MSFKYSVLKVLVKASGFKKSFMTDDVEDLLAKRRKKNAKMLSIIHDNFDNATVMMECLAKKWVNKEKVEKSIKDTGAKFIYGADCFEDIKDIAPGFKKIKDDNITRGMTAVIPAVKPFAWMPLVKKSVQKILIFEKEQ